VRYRTERGFTLVEVMVAMAIMLMVMTVAFSGFRIGLNAWERGGREIDRMEHRATVERLILRQLTAAYPMQLTVGTKDGIQFVADYSLSDGSVDFRRIQYVIKDGDFLYSETPIYVGRDVDSAPNPQIGLADMDSVSFQYLGKDEHGNAVWKDEWKFGEGMPLAIRVQLDNDNFVVRLVNR
jgi:prepilin-type N-terminal cleavage/methylation domain-containing protein